MELKLTVSLEPHLNPDEIERFRTVCKVQSITPESAVASMIRRFIKSPAPKRHQRRVKA